jgi:cyclopropane fatty-acyl-phospholipid synthase-like methyltransferase
VNPDRFGEIALRDRKVNNPLGLAALDWIIDLTSPPKGGRVLDAGCGRGEFLLRLAQRRPIQGVGIDRKPREIRLAQAGASERTLRGTLRFRCTDVRSLRPPSEPYFLSVCLGATHAFGGLKRTLDTLREWTQPDGWVVVGEGFWKRPPSPGYLRVLRATPEELLDDRGNVRAGERLGLVLAGHRVSSREEWDDFEDDYAEGIERYAKENRGDSEVPEMLDRIRRWRNAYLRWGRQTLGFGVYAFKKTSRHDPATTKEN